MFEMGIDMELVPLGAAMFSGPAGQKEADSAFGPAFHHLKSGWPTLLLECGVSESLACMQAEARWWLENSGEAVKTVIVISVSRPEKSLHLEKWELVAMPDPGVTPAYLSPSIVKLDKTHHVDIVGGVVTGGPLTIKFQDVMLRDPEPGEDDVVFGIEDLANLAKNTWAGAQ